MAQNQKRIIGRMAARLFSLPVGEYLVSENFSRFLEEADLDDTWKESLDLSRDRPDLYGSDVMKNALVEFLYHMFFRRPEEFPALFSRFLSGFSREISRPLQFSELENDLKDLGYAGEKLKVLFSTPGPTGAQDTSTRKNSSLYKEKQ